MEIVGTDGVAGTVAIAGVAVTAGVITVAIHGVGNAPIVGVGADLASAAVCGAMAAKLL